MPVSVATSPAFETKLKTYPPKVQPVLVALRDLIHQTAHEIPELENLEEGLKWSEPSFMSAKGSTLRMDWKAKNPEQYALYFQCSSRLVETFRKVFASTFKFEGNRAIVFAIEDPLPVTDLKKCIKATLLYHTVKDQVLLGL